MAKLTLVETNVRSNTNLAHRASATEGQAARRLLESQGYIIKRVSNGQMELRCPFHQGPGQVEARKGVSFYMNAENSMYFCQSASCGERGNLTTLERFFGIESSDDDYAATFKSRETQLREFERNLPQGALRRPFYEHGLTDATIERFRLGFEPSHVEQIKGSDGSIRSVTIPDRYVIPYLEGRRPKMFRYYQPNGDPKYKYMWEPGSEAALYNGQDAIGDKDGIVFLCEGEQKAMLLVQMGYAAVAVPGAGQWRDEFQAAFTHARKIMVCFDNDNPIHHVYDKPDRRCAKCAGRGLDRCQGHNPGQEAALARVEQIGWRAQNILLPLPSDDARKTDINDYFVRDGATGPDFAQLALGKSSTPYKVQTLAEIIESPPEEAQFLIEQGILPRSGRLLIAGKPKVGKSIMADNLALSLASGIPFLGRFKVDSGDPIHPGVRTLLLDRELSKRSLFDRMGALMEGRPGYRAAVENLLIDHDHLIRLDQKDSYDVMMNLVETNGAEVVILDTAYKFLGGDVESSSALMKAFDVLDRVIHNTGAAIVMTHHMKKGQNARGKENTDIADPDSVTGSFLWTGWPNATILLNYMNRSVENPFNSICTFTAFRDAAAPEPLALYRDRTSISYSAVQDYSHDENVQSGPKEYTKPSTDAVQELLLELAPVTEEEFLHMASVHFGASATTIRPYFLDAMTSGYFERTAGKPPVIRYKSGEAPQASWESDHGLAERPLPRGYDYSQETLGAVS